MIAISIGLPIRSANAAITSNGDTYTAPGNTSTWIGYTGTGTLRIDGDSDYSTNAFSLGQVAGASGTVTVSGTGSTLTTNQSVYIASAGIGNLVLESGAVMTSNGLPSYPTFYGVTVGYGSGGKGTVTVDGDGTKWIIPNMGIAVGTTNGTGSVTVNHGGLISSTGLGVSAGSTLLITGTDLVTHAASTVNTGSFSVDSITTGGATVSAGGILNSSGVSTIGSFLGRTGTMTVTGQNSQWNAVGSLNIGALSGTGSLTVADGALVSVSNTGSASGTGNGLITLGGSPQSTNPGTPASTGNLYIGTGGAAGRLNVAEVNGYYSTSTNPVTVPAISTITFNHNEAGYEFKNSSGTGILISGSTKVVNQAGTTILTAANTYLGGTEVTGGKLIVNNTTGLGTGSGAITVSGSGQLGGHGTVGAIVVGNGGSTYPGDPQVLTAASVQYQAGSTAQFAIETNSAAVPTAGVDYDRIAITGGTAGALAIDSGATLQINLTSDALSYLQNLSAESTPANYFLFTLGSGTSTGNFGQLTITEGGNTYTESIVDGEVNFTDLGLALRVGYTGDAAGNSLTGGHDVTFSVVAVPEPTTAALLLCMGMGGLAVRRRSMRG
ncbi:MAG: PEP-CTERM sorting domain-containing protein [Luteolibacter sp.]